MSAFTYWRSSARDVALMAPTGPVLPLPFKNPLSHENKFNGQLLEKAMTLEQQGIFTIAMLHLLSIEI